MKNPLDYFFNLGDKATKGDPYRKSLFDYYLLWIMFLAFFSILVGNLWDFYKTERLAHLGWSGVMFAILWFQYFGLRQARLVTKAMKDQRNIISKPEDNKIESVEEMLASIKK